MTGAGGLIETFHFLLLLCTLSRNGRRNSLLFSRSGNQKKIFTKEVKISSHHRRVVRKIRIRHGTSSSSSFPYAHVRFPYFCGLRKKMDKPPGKSRRHVFPAVASGHRKGGEKKERIRANYLGVGGEGGAILINVFPSSSSSIFFSPRGRESEGCARSCVLAKLLL